MSTVLLETVHPLSIKGTTLAVGGRSYHFTPNRNGAYVAEVLDVDAPTILAISAGYRVYTDQSEKALHGHFIQEPPEVREAAARAIPAPPTPPGGKPAPLGRMKRDGVQE